jgi:hypothetical protein
VDKQQETYMNYWKQAGEEFDRDVAPKVIHLRNDLRRCQVDTKTIDSKMAFRPGDNGGEILQLIYDIRVIGDSIREDKQCGQG